MKNHVKNHFAGAIDTLKAELLKLQEHYPNITDEEAKREDELIQAIALLSGEVPVFAHLYSFGEDLNVSLHPTEDMAIRDIKKIWTANKFNPEEDRSLIASVRINGEAGEGHWLLTEEGGLVNNQGDQLLNFSIYRTTADNELAAASEHCASPIDWNRYELTAQVVATQELTIDEECTHIDWNSIEEITSTSLIFVRDVKLDLVFDVDVENMDDDRIIREIVVAIQQHEKECDAENTLITGELIIGAKYEFVFMNSVYIGVLLSVLDGFLEFGDVQDATEFTPAPDIRADSSQLSNVRYADED